MGRNRTRDQHRRFGGARRFGATMGVLAVALLALPATGLAAKTSFGADLKMGGYSAVNKPKKCKWDKTKPCTRLPTLYANPWPVGPTDYAPHTGVIKKIQLVAENPGKLRIQIGETFNQGLPQGEVQSNGPKLHYAGTGEIETFKVHIPVHKFDYVGFRAKRASTLNCNQPAGLESSFQFDPPLQPGAPLQVSSWQEECTHLIRAKMRY